MTPRKVGEASRPEVSRRPEVKGGTPEIGNNYNFKVIKHITKSNWT